MFMRSYTSPRPLADEWDWQLSGTCRDTDPALFYDDTNERGSRRAKRESSAKLVCARCLSCRDAWCTPSRPGNPTVSGAA